MRVSPTPWQRDRNGAVIELTVAAKMRAVRDLAAAIAAITLEVPVHATEAGNETAADVGKVLGEIASALQNLGFEVDANIGGFGVAPEIDVQAKWNEVEK